MWRACPERGAPEVAVLHEHVRSVHRDVIVPYVNVCVVDPKWSAMDINAICVGRLRTSNKAVRIECLCPVHNNLHVRNLYIICPELDSVISAICRSKVPQRKVTGVFDRDELRTNFRILVRPPRRTVSINRTSAPNCARNARVDVEK